MQELLPLFPNLFFVCLFTGFCFSPKRKTNKNPLCMNLNATSSLNSSFLPLFAAKGLQQTDHTHSHHFLTISSALTLRIMTHVLTSPPKLLWGTSAPLSNRTQCLSSGPHHSWSFCDNQKCCLRTDFPRVSDPLAVWFSNH